MQLGTRITLAVAAASLFACGDSAPSNPTWTEDVKPILLANCIKCHSHPARFGAPDTFRLDVFEDTINDRGQNILGAASMVRFVHERTANETMPPTIPLTDRQIDILRNWSEARPDNFTEAERGAAPAGNRAPTMTLERRLDASLVGETLIILYNIDDEDFDVVTGSLSVTAAGGNPVVVARELYSGRGQVVWDIGTFAEDSYSVTATLTDGNATFDIDLGSYSVVHPSGNTAPTVSFTFPTASDIVRPADAPAIDFEIVDPDTLDTLAYDLDAVLGEETVSLVAGGSLAADAGPQSINPDLTGLRPSANWRLRLTVTDGTSSRIVFTDSFVVSDTDTTSTYADVSAIITTHCTGCHPGGEIFIPPVGFDFTGFAGASALADRIYRRAVLERNMPPRSASTLFPSSAEMTQAERDTLADWILGGAPEN